MRRMSLLGLGLMMFGTVVGCHHVAGVCDCEKSPALVNAEPPLSQGAVTPVSAPMMNHAETIK
jgi:hypothetical protein